MPTTKKDKRTEQEKKIDLYIESVVATEVRINPYTKKEDSEINFGEKLTKIPQAKHIRNPLKQKSDNWQETADHWIFDIKGISFEYYTGVGHRIPRKGLPSQHDKKEIELMQRKNLTDSGFARLISMTTAKKPALRDLLCSLTMDSYVAHETFENWCCYFGYDTDSIKALRIYHECQEQTNKLVKLGFNLETLQELFQDY